MLVKAIEVPPGGCDGTAMGPQMTAGMKRNSPAAVPACPAGLEVARPVNPLLSPPLTRCGRKSVGQCVRLYTLDFVTGLAAFFRGEWALFAATRGNLPIVPLVQRKRAIYIM